MHSTSPVMSIVGLLGCSLVCRQINFQRIFFASVPNVSSFFFWISTRSVVFIRSPRCPGGFRGIRCCVVRCVRGSLLLVLVRLSWAITRQQVGWYVGI